MSAWVQLRFPVQQVCCGFAVGVAVAEWVQLSFLLQQCFHSSVVGVVVVEWVQSMADDTYFEHDWVQEHEEKCTFVGAVEIEYCLAWGD